MFLSQAGKAEMQKTLQRFYQIHTVFLQNDIGKTRRFVKTIMLNASNKGFNQEDFAAVQNF